MSNRYWLAGFVALVLGFPTTNCLARDPHGEPILGRAEAIGVLLVATVVDESAEGDAPARPILGPAEPIGRLILVASAVEEYDEYAEEPTARFLNAVVVEEAPQLGPTVLLASLIPEELNSISIPRPVHPDEIQQRLRQAADLLAASGLDAESQEIQKVVARIEREHYERLLLKQKETELAVLQAEVDRLRNSIGRKADAPQVLVSLTLIKTEHQSASKDSPAAEAKEAVGDLFGKSFSKVASEQESRQHIDDLLNRGSGKILSEPKLLVLSGQTGKYQSGGQIQIPTSNNAQAVGRNTRDIGTTVVASPEVLDGNRIRLGFIAEFKEVNHAHSVDGIPGINCRRIQTNVEFEPGETIFVGPGSGGMVIAVKAEVLPAASPVPLSDPYSPQPFKVIRRMPAPMPIVK